MRHPTLSFQYHCGVRLRGLGPRASLLASTNGLLVFFVSILLKVLLVISSLFLILSILLHKGKGGGVSDMFGGGISSSMSSSGVAERNLNRITVVTAVVWATSIILIGVLELF